MLKVEFLSLCMSQNLSSLLPEWFGSSCRFKKIFFSLLGPLAYSFSGDNLIRVAL